MLITKNHFYLWKCLSSQQKEKKKKSHNRPSAECATYDAFATNGVNLSGSIHPLSSRSTKLDKIQAAFSAVGHFHSYCVVFVLALPRRKIIEFGSN